MRSTPAVGGVAGIGSWGRVVARFVLWSALVTLMPACSSRSTVPAVGQRVELPYWAIVDTDRPSERRSVTGELVRSSADTVCVRKRPGEDAHCFGTRPGARLRSRVAGDVSDPWLVGDSLRVGNRIDGRSRWGVVGWSADTLVLVGATDDPLRAAEAARYVGEGAQRQVYRPRPTGRLVLGGLFLAGGLAWANHLKGGEPTPAGELEASDLVAPILAVSTVMGGVIGVLSAPFPYLDWDDVDVSTLPPLRVEPGRGHAPQLGAMVTVRFR